LTTPEAVSFTSCKTVTLTAPPGPQVRLQDGHAGKRVEFIKVRTKPSPRAAPTSGGRRVAPALDLRPPDEPVSDPGVAQVFFNHQLVFEKQNQMC